MSDQAILLPKLSPHWRIILAKGQLDHSYTFWTMANYTCYTSTKFADSHIIFFSWSDFLSWSIGVCRTDQLLISQRIKVKNKYLCTCLKAKLFVKVGTQGKRLKKNTHLLEKMFALWYRYKEFFYANYFKPFCTGDPAFSSTCD